MERQGTRRRGRGAYYYRGDWARSVNGDRVIRARGAYELGASAMIAWAAIWAVLLAASRRRRPADSLREGLSRTRVELRCVSIHIASAMIAGGGRLGGSPRLCVATAAADASRYTERW